MTSSTGALLQDITHSTVKLSNSLGNVAEGTGAEDERDLGEGKT